MEEELKNKTQESIQKILDGGINSGNIDHLYRLVKTNHIAKEDMQMYGNYGARRPGYDSYGYDNYGRHGYDMRYKGDEEINRISGEYTRYMENRSRYGTNEETDRSFHYMVKALEDFIKVLYEEAETPQQKQTLRDSLQRSIM